MKKCPYCTEPCGNAHCAWGGGEKPKNMDKKDWAILASVFLLPGGSLLGLYWLYKKTKTGK